MKTARSTWVLVAATGIAAATAGAASAAKPLTGTIGGPVTAVQGQTFTLKSTLTPTGKAKVHVKKATVINEQQTASRSALKNGVCVVAVGQKNKQGVVQATRVMLSAPVKGSCQGGFGGRPGNGTPPQGTPRPRNGQQPPGNGRQPPQGQRPPGNRADFGFASGGIIAVSGSVLTVNGRQGKTKVSVSAKTEIVRTARVGMSAVKVGLCAFVRGASSDKGVNVDAESVELSKPGPQGCTGGFRRR